MAAIERAEEALAEAETLLSRLAQEAEDDPARAGSDRGAAVRLRAAARKHGVNVVALPEFLQPHCGRGWRRWRPARPISPR